MYYKYFLFYYLHSKAELAIRDLNNKPPYKLKVFLLKSNDPDNVKILNSSDKNIFKEGVEGKR